MTNLKIVNGKVTNPESDTLELKSCRTSLSKDFWPTYSAFANTFGGTIILGVDDKTRELTGVDDPEKVTKEIWDLINDGRKVNVNLLSPDDITQEDVGGKIIIEVRIPRAERRKRPVYINNTMENGTYKRNGEGDYHCSIRELQQMLRDASDISHDSEILEDMSLDDLDGRSISSFRERVSRRNPAHPWNDKENGEFLRLIGACARSRDGTLHPTLAGLMMFGYDYSIMSAIPNYHLDYLEFPEVGDDWTYRITTGTGEFTGNVYNFAIEVSNRLMMCNDRGKTMDGVVRVDDSPLIRAQRELVVNALIHADYEGLRGIRVEWRKGMFSVRNPGNLRIPLDEMLAGGISDPRNPRIAMMLGLIGMVERAGSGVSDVVSYCRRHGIPDPSYRETTEPETVTATLTMRLDGGSDGLEDMIIEMMRNDPTISLDVMSRRTGVERNKLARFVNGMKGRGIVERIGGTRGHWEVS